MVPVNFSVTSQGELEGENVLHAFAVRGGEEDICQNIFCHHSDFFMVIHDQQYQIDWIELFAVQKLICRTQISNGVDRLDPNTTRIKITNLARETTTHFRSNRLLLYFIISRIRR